MSIKFSTEKPPVLDQCCKQFGVTWDQGITITYGDTIHRKWMPIEEEDLIVHEATHVKQQTDMGKDKWWKLYFANPQFRLEQEVEAYRTQLDFANKNYNRHKRRHIKKHIIDCMSSLYGSMCSKEEAEKLLQ